MGFSMILQIVRPETRRLYDEAEQVRGHCTFWMPDGIMTGYASWPGREEDMPDGKSLAELGMLGLPYGKVVLSKAKKPNRRIVAPPFAIFEDLKKNPYGGIIFFGAHEWMRPRTKELASGAQIIMPLWNMEAERGFPDV